VPLTPPSPSTPPPPPPNSLDTGRLNAETYQLFDAVEKHYKIRIEYTFPDAEETMELVRTKGLYSFYEDGHQECCRVRKVGVCFCVCGLCGLSGWVWMGVDGLIRIGAGALGVVEGTHLIK